MSVGWMTQQKLMHSSEDDEHWLALVRSVRVCGAGHGATCLGAEWPTTVARTPAPVRKRRTPTIPTPEFTTAPVLTRTGRSVPRSPQIWPQTPTTSAAADCMNDSLYTFSDPAEPHSPHPTEPSHRNPNACHCLSLPACALLAACIIVDHFRVLLRLSAARCITRRRRCCAPCTSTWHAVSAAGAPVCMNAGSAAR